MSGTVIQEFSETMQMDSVELWGSSDSDLEVDNRLIPSFGVLTQDTERVPMDTHYQSEFGFLSDIAVQNDDVPYTVFTIHTLFDAAADGDKNKLKGLLTYLKHTSKCLTDLEFRDPTSGKTVLLKALLNLRNGQNDTVELLLAIAEETGDLDTFVNAAYKDSFYKGQSALHIAIERRSLHFVKLLVQKGAYVQAKAHGKFFQLNTKPGFYFGELPLSLAACTNQLNIVEYLLWNPYQKADITDKDSHGNIVLHALVTIADNSPENTAFVTKMYDEILLRAGKLYPRLKLEEIENNQGLNPIKLAAKTGKIGLFRHMVRREFLDEESIHLSRKFTEWAYGPVYSSLYDLDSLDTYEKNSVLEIIVYDCENPNRHDMLQIEPLHSLLEEKWHTFARPIFWFNFVVYVVYLGIFTSVSCFRKEGKPPFPIEHETSDYFRLGGEIISLLGAVYFFFRGISDFRRKRPKLKTLQVDGYSEFLFLLQAVLLLISAVMYASGCAEYVGCLVISLALSWVNLLYFSRGSKHMGIYSVMIQRMILSDISRFLFVYIVFLFGFSTAVVTLIEEPPVAQEMELGAGCQRHSYNNIYFTTLELFKFTIGMGDLEFTEQYQYKQVFFILLISYIVLTYILLLNMLIALMNETVEKISRESESLWKLQRALTILDLERSLPRWLRKNLRSGVLKELGDRPGNDIRRCFSLEEVNWSKWQTDLGIITKEIGSRDIEPTHQKKPLGEAAWLRLPKATCTRTRDPEESIQQRASSGGSATSDLESAANRPQSETTTSVTYMRLSHM
ncbi:transient receptor potential cation channel subfamily V member 1-like isoform X1 [Alosa sapidissima]|uniref:transient receptor potential cation channel subfamily V member 1-like isoform X1 n=2 Tax=Alosa sapidissima TaxID=34773 RepID=UPI001C0A3DD9|nr:transient receptor potential cation channel subfamily V member 1-like isoform X1 [Alosa sapidissima]XP_041919354.1 transient receptor potential cation channel subfamily V member 1-like isoform X1 [Alosa sapidissima]XP_041919355.1 transient receptor potential cation channel subfamily V member 1-like isoform X1 [Alosa sapidissima]